MSGETQREERLREMGLAPIWRQRAEQAGAMEPASAMTGAVESSPPPGTPARPTAGPVVRPEREAVTPSVSAPAAPEAKVTVPAAPIESTPAALPVGSGEAATREAAIAALDWAQLPAHIAACTACGLCRTRRQTVPGVGPASAGWMFVGEAPGAEEDAQGEPFVGQAGRLLDNMLRAIGLSRPRDTYIANVLKCRPPNNRNPEPGEVAQCTPYLERQVALLQPRIIVALGRFAAMTLLNTDATIASLRGRVHAYRGVPLIVTYHPAYLLRNLPDKAKAWEDLLLAKRTAADLQPGQSTPI